MNNNANRKREEIEDIYKWKLEDIYADENLWEQDFNEVKSLISEMAELQGTLRNSDSTLTKALQLSDTLELKAEKLYVYARMRRDEDNTKNRYQALFDKAEGLNIEVGSTTSFMVPEILAIPEDTLKDYMETNQELSIYSHFLEEILRQKAHILSPEEERLLAMSADLSMASGNIFTMLNNADIKFPTIKDTNGELVELTKGRYGSFMEGSDRRVRQDAFSALYGSYQKLINTIGSTLSSSIKRDIFYAKARKYDSALQASLDQDNIPIEVYNNLIASVHAHLPSMYRYMKIRKRIMEIDELHMYDIYAPLVKEYKMEVPYEKAQETVVKALVPLGEEYNSILKKGFSSGWIDVYENEGKTSGAYSWGTYDTNPYVLMNYDNKLDDMFTIAHELGHSLHSYYSNRSQPYVYSKYSIFVAEVASTVNESLLIEYLLHNSQEKEEKVYLINHYLEQFRGTMFRQTMFAEFEKIVHEQVEQGQALTPENLNKIYRDLNRLYYGPDITLDDQIDLEWARIPHFYSAFYVYKYATGFGAATAIKEKITKQGAVAVKPYLEFLKSGGSDYPIKQLQKAGVDLTTPQPVNDALDYFGQLLDQLEALL